MSFTFILEFRVIYTHYSHFFQVYWRFVLFLWLCWVFLILHVLCRAALLPMKLSLLLLMDWFWLGYNFTGQQCLILATVRPQGAGPPLLPPSPPGGKESVLCFSSIMQNKTKQNKLLAIKECLPLFFVSNCHRDQALLVVQHKVWGEMESSSAEGTLRGHVARCTLRSHRPSVGESQTEAVFLVPTEACLGEGLMWISWDCSS